MPMACRAYLIHEGETTEIIVNINNLAVLVKEKSDISDIVVVGPFNNHFILNFKKGKIRFCSDPKVKEIVEAGLMKIDSESKTELFFYKGFIQYRSIQTVNICAASELQAKEVVQKWTSAPLKHLIKVA
ncbi:hypothetical protein D1B31_17825 [Neobacillus notoginsengisoli]|uniref:Uncharacterized protein n=1 Tax=Neobacillus notoginsengisoli TaxID=1578198 RepID=A0A417YQD1_9BACI|nr:hypothetical protein [Neobacillus notoginsengisoli]RHW35951.1 hypothetical protein D1B31_17825 [Neobacillus notoginsengisoli]